MPSALLKGTAGHLTLQDYRAGGYVEPAPASKLTYLFVPTAPTYDLQRLLGKIEVR